MAAAQAALVVAKSKGDADLIAKAKVTQANAVIAIADAGKPVAKAAANGATYEKESYTVVQKSLKTGVMGAYESKLEDWAKAAIGPEVPEVKVSAIESFGASTKKFAAGLTAWVTKNKGLAFGYLLGGLLIGGSIGVFSAGAASPQSFQLTADTASTLTPAQQQLIGVIQTQGGYLQECLLVDGACTSN
jgi:hypothetical protein